MADLVRSFQFGDLCFRSMDEVSANLIVRWRYEEAFSLYNYEIHTRDQDIQSLLNPKNFYFAIFDSHDQFIGFRCFGSEAQVHGGDYPPGPMDTGGGLRPDLTGQGRGLEVISAGLELGRVLFSPPEFRVTVASFNLRALKVCTRAGFMQITQFRRPLDGLEFTLLKRPS